MGSCEDSLLKEAVQNLSEKPTVFISNNSSSFQTSEIGKSQTTTENETTVQDETNMTSMFPLPHLDYDCLEVDESKMLFESEISHYENDCHIDSRIFAEQISKMHEERLKFNLSIDESSSKAREGETPEQKAEKSSTPLHPVPVALICNVSNIQNIEPLTNQQSTTQVIQTPIENKKTLIIPLCNLSSVMPVEEKITPLSSEDHPLTSCVSSIKNDEPLTAQIPTSEGNGSRAAVNVQSSLSYTHILCDKEAACNLNVWMVPSETKKTKLPTGEHWRSYRAGEKTFVSPLSPNEKKKREAERGRLYRARNKALMSHMRKIRALMSQLSSIEKKEKNTSTTAECSGKYDEYEKVLMSQLPPTHNQEGNTSTATECSRYSECKNTLISQLGPTEKKKKITMSSTERGRRFRARKRALMSLMAPTEEKPKNTRTSAERTRRYRARKQTMSQVSPIETKEENTLTTAECENTLMSQPASSEKKKKITMTSTERSRKFRARKQALMPQLLPIEKKEENAPSTERCARYDECKKALMSELAPTEKKKKNARTSAERTRKYRARKQALISQLSSVDKKKKHPLTAVEHTRRYRECENALAPQLSPVVEEKENTVTAAKCSCRCEQALMPLQPPIEKKRRRPMTAAERTRKFRARKKAAMSQQLSSERDELNAERCGYCKRGQILKSVESNVGNSERLEVLMVANEAQNLSQPSTKSSQTQVNVQSSVMYPHFLCAEEPTCNLSAQLISIKNEEVKLSST